MGREGQEDVPRANLQSRCVRLIQRLELRISHRRIDPDDRITELEDHALLHERANEPFEVDVRESRVFRRGLGQ